MDADRLLRVAVAASVAVAAVLGVGLNGLDADRAWGGRAAHEIDAFAIADQALRREMLSARVGLSRHYDGLNRAVTASEAALRELAALSGRDPPLAERTRALAGRVAERHAAVERFKTDNALLQNALARFASLSNAQAADPLGRLPPFILRLTLDTSREAVRDARDELARLFPGEPGGAARAVAAQVRQLIALLPEVDDLLRALRDDGLDPETRAVREAIAGRERTDRARHAALSWLLAGALLGGLAASIALALRAVERARALRRRSANENLSATVTGLLLEPDGRDADDRIGRALERLAAHAGTARVVLALGERPLRVTAWPEMRDGRVERLTEAIAASRALGDWDHDLLALPPDGDGRAVLLLRDGEPAQAVLGIEAGRALRVRRPELVAGLRMGLAALVQAVRREAAIAERIALERRLAEAERLKAIGMIASGVAHNFNNIVGAIGGFSEMARERVGSDDAVAGHLDEIGQAVSRARTLVEDILGFAGRGPATAHRVRLAPLLHETAGLLRASYPEDTTVAVRADGPDAVRGSAARLQQVFMNLCNNALTAVPGRATIALTVTQRRLDRAAQLSHAALAAGDYAVVAVDDEGPGVPRAILPRLFEPFFTTRPGGTGLGLSTAWTIVRDHGGSINVVLPEGGGSSFEVWLPRAADGTIDEGHDAARWRGTGERILLLTPDARAADDETLLAELGCEPVHLPYADAPEYLDAALAGVDAVLAIDLPPHVADRLRRRDADAPPVIVVGGGEADAFAARLSLPLREEALANAMRESLASAARVS